LSTRDLGGMLASAGIQHLPGVIPDVVYETERTIVVVSPIPEARLDYVFFPKKDIKNVGDLTQEDAEYLMDLFLAARHIIEQKGLTAYRFYTNGPGFQKITYLHFHLLSDQEF
jgi:diadenosine tetraphosphate (Ap4A) HIT family hydrolase